MDKRPAYSLFPGRSPTSPTGINRSRRSTDRKRRSTSLDPLPPIEEPSDVPPVPDSPSQEQPYGLKPIHSLYNPRPPSRRSPGEQQRPLSQYQESISSRPSEDNQPSSRRSSLHQPLPPPLPPAHPLEHEPPPPKGQNPHDMLAPSPSTASSVSLQKPPILSPTSTLQVNPPRPSQQKLAYFHGGIGGRGNYRKVVREHNRAPLAHARNASSPNGRSARFLTSLFGGARRRTSPNRDTGRLAEGRSSEESIESSEKEEVSLGAAEVMRRKLLRQAGLMPKSARNDIEESN